jgi:hypothetical protein
MLMSDLMGRIIVAGATIVKAAYVKAAIAG